MQHLFIYSAFVFVHFFFKKVLTFGDWLAKMFAPFHCMKPPAFFSLSLIFITTFCAFLCRLLKNCNCAFNCEASPSQCCACVRDSQFDHSVLLRLRWAGLDYAVVDCFLFLLSGDGSTEGCVLANKIEEHLFCDQGFSINLAAQKRLLRVGIR